MNISLSQLNSIISKSVDAGVEAYRFGVNPDGDRVKRAEARRWMARLGYKTSILDRWVADGLISELRGAHSVTYSRKEIKKLIAAIEVKSIINQ